MFTCCTIYLSVKRLMQCSPINVQRNMHFENKHTKENLHKDLPFLFSYLALECGSKMHSMSLA